MKGGCNRPVWISACFDYSILLPSIYNILRYVNNLNLVSTNSRQPPRMRLSRSKSHHSLVTVCVYRLRSVARASSSMEANHAGIIPQQGLQTVLSLFLLITCWEFETSYCAFLVIVKNRIRLRFLPNWPPIVRLCLFFAAVKLFYPLITNYLEI